MMFQTLVVALSLMTITLANPVVQDPTQDAAYNSLQGYPVVADLSPLVETVVEMQYNLDSLVLLLEELSVNISTLTPHVIHKRQTTVSGRVENGAEGTRGHLDVIHQSGGTRATGNVNFGSGGTGWGAGIDHTTPGGWNFGGNVNRNPGGSTSGRIDVGRTWNDGNTQFGGFAGRSGGSNQAGISFSHRFRK